MMMMMMMMKVTLTDLAGLSFFRPLSVFVRHHRTRAHPREMAIVRELDWSLSLNRRLTEAEAEQQRLADEEEYEKAAELSVEIESFKEESASSARRLR